MSKRLLHGRFANFYVLSKTQKLKGGFSLLNEAD
jgi:hypothetical protein